MERIELLLHEATALTFGVDVHGTTVSKLLPRLSIESSVPGMQILISGTYDGGNVMFDLPILSNLLSHGTHVATLELILEGERYFTPLKIELECIGKPNIETKIITQVLQGTPQPEIYTSTSYKITAKLKKDTKKTEEELIAENIDILAQCKNVQSLCFEYSKKILMRPNYIPLNAKEIMLKLDLFCQNTFQKTFSEYSMKFKG